jgi:hypothetical protein
MPFIIPPPSFDVPAIIRAAAHASGSPMPVRRPVTVPRHIEQPDGNGQGPDTVTSAPTAPHRPTIPATPPVAQPDGGGQLPDIITPAPIVPPRP